MSDKYMNNAQKAEDNRSSGWVLLIIGCIGLVVIILGFLGLLPLPINGFSRKMSMGVLGALCILFVVMGIVSLKKSKEFAAQAQKEGDRESLIIDWFKANNVAENIDNTIRNAVGELSEEEVYFQRESLIKQILYKQFPDIGMEFLDHMADEVYEAIFGEE